VYSANALACQWCVRPEIHTSTSTRRERVLLGGKCIQCIWVLQTLQQSFLASNPLQSYLDPVGLALGLVVRPELIFMPLQHQSRAHSHAVRRDYHHWMWSGYDLARWQSNHSAVGIKLQQKCQDFGACPCAGCVPCWFSLKALCICISDNNNGGSIQIWLSRFIAYHAHLR